MEKPRRSAREEKATMRVSHRVGVSGETARDRVKRDLESQDPCGLDTG